MHCSVLVAFFIIQRVAKINKINPHNLAFPLKMTFSPPPLKICILKQVTIWSLATSLTSIMLTSPTTSARLPSPSGWQPLHLISDHYHFLWLPLACWIFVWINLYSVHFPCRGVWIMQTLAQEYADRPSPWLDSEGVPELLQSGSWLHSSSWMVSIVANCWALSCWFVCADMSCYCLFRKTSVPKDLPFKAAQYANTGMISEDASARSQLSSL